MYKISFHSQITGLVKSLLFLSLLFLHVNGANAQCTECPPGSTYSGLFYASSTNLSGVHPCLAINGVYVVDENVSITSSTIYLGPGAEIRVGNGAELELNNCTISGCNEMWQNIKVIAGGKLIAEDVVFSDGIDAILAKKESDLIVKNCTFTNNYIGLHLNVKLYPDPRPIYLSEPLSNNIFQSDGTLLPPYAGETSYAGIKVVNAAPITIGAQNYPQNQFLDIKNGIITEYSMVTVDNALFQQADATSSIQMTGISSENSSLTVESSTFNRCFDGIFSTASNLYIKDNSFSSVLLTGVRINNSPNKIVKITDNLLTNMTFIGIDASDGGVFQEFLVNNNEVEMDDLSFVPIAAIRLNSAVPTNQNNSTISNNFVEMFGTKSGIIETFNRNINILENRIELLHDFNLSGQIEEHAIIVSYCGGSNIVKDTVISTTDGSSSTIHDIEVNFSENCSVSCNYVDGGDSGIRFKGACSNTTLSQNQINNHGIGLDIGGSQSYIGMQAPSNNARDNQWDGGYSNWGAFNEAEPIFAAQSLFHVRSTSTPQMPPSVDATILNWFDDDGSGPKPYCPAIGIEPPIDGLATEPTDFEKMIANGSVPFIEYEVAELWRAQTTLFRRLKNNQQLLGIDQDIDVFYTSSQNGTIGIFYEIAEGISDLAIPDAGLAQEYEALENDINDKMMALSVIDAQLLTASGSVYEDLVEGRHMLIGVIDSLHLEILQLDSIILAQRIILADQLIALNSTITTSSLPQQLQQTVNEIYLSTIGKGVLELSTTQVDLLEPIANMCLFEGGDAVLIARILLRLVNGEQEYDDELLCGESGEFLSGSGQGSDYTSGEAGRLVLQPNPAKGEVKITFPLIQEQGEIDIFDLQGILRHSVILAAGQNSHSLSLEGFMPGLYFVSVKNDKQVIVQKLEVTE